MTWTTKYNKADASIWQGRADIPPASCFFQVIQPLDLSQPFTLASFPFEDDSEPKQAFALLGFCSDEGIKRNRGRVGAAEGPKAIRQALASLPFHHSHAICYDAGDIICQDGDLESSQAALGEAVSILLKNDITPIVIGGGHELAWGHYQGLEKQFQEDQISIVNFDAHFDMRPSIDGKGSSGTPFLQIAESLEKNNKEIDYTCIGIQRPGNIKSLFETADKYNTKILMADTLHPGNKKECDNFINQIIFYKKFIYLSLCLDVFSTAFAPGVSAPQAMGVTPWKIMSLVKKLAASGKVISYDIAELSPKHDIDNRTAKLAANFVYEIIHHHLVQ